MIRWLGIHLTLRTKLLISFLAIVLIIVLFTLYIVQSATFRHSTGLLRTNADISNTVISDHIREVANLLHASATTLTTDFNTKQLILSADTDEESLNVAMQNFADRFEAEEFAVVEQGGAILSASETFASAYAIDVEYLAQDGITWFEYDNEIYLAKAAAVKNTPRSRSAMAWLVFAMRAPNLINEELTRLTTMDLSLLRDNGANLEFISSTYDESVIGEFAEVSVSEGAELQDLYLPSDHYIFLVTPLGDYDNSPVYLKLSTIESNAYLSYYSLLGRLIGLLIVVSAIALAAAMLIANGITKPILTLVNLTQEIRQGVQVKKFPIQSTTEVNTLSNAINTMQSAIIKREKEIQRLAFFDSVTMLPNRNSFIKRLEQQITEQPDAPFSVVLLDIARFKEINDTIGHIAGDRLLSLVGERISSGCRDNIFIARLGGDEFAIIDANDGKTEKLMDELVNLFVTPFDVETLSLDIDVSIGGATYKEHGTSPSDLMQAADIALHTTKDSHKTYTLYNEALNTFSLQRLRLMGELKDALAEGQLSLYYQPKMSLSDDIIRSVECLIRWIHPEHGFIPPDDFIPLAEQTGAVRFITGWALRQAAIQHSQWRSQGLDIAMAVNISAVDLTDLSLPYTVSALLSEFDMTPDKLIIEVTESAVMSDPQVAINALNMLSRMGIKLSIDDFGTGFSSMAQLKKMPVDEIKIDKAFVLELASNSDDQVMVKTLIAMAENLGLSTVAEGVEDQESVELLRSMRCSTAQGFHLSRPLPSKDITPWLEKANCVTCE